MDDSNIDLFLEFDDSIFNLKDIITRSKRTCFEDENKKRYLQDGW